MTKSAQFTYVDLFCGAGGMSLGFERAGFKCLEAVDSWRVAVDTFNTNLPPRARVEALNFDSELVSADVIVGGPPCQGFSSAGTRRSDDPRNNLVSVFASLVAKYRPKAFVFENVEGFITAGQGLFVHSLLEPLVECGYAIHLKKVNVANYGVPQLRKRVIAIGGLNWEPEFPKITHSAFGAPGSHLMNQPDLPRVSTLGDFFKSKSQLGDLADDEPVQLTPEEAKRVILLKPGQSMKDLPEELWHESYRRRANRRVSDGTPSEKRGGAPYGIRRLNPLEPCRAITSAATHEFIHPHSDRALTIRECALIQTFPPEYHFKGSSSEKILQIGNAVPPLFAFRIAKSLEHDLRNPFIKSNGGLVSFVPTHSNGSSPVLQKVTKQVRDRYKKPGRLFHGFE